MVILAGYTSSMFRDLESNLRTESDLVDDDSRLVLNENNSILLTYDLAPRTYAFQDLFEVVLRSLHSE